MLQAVTIQINLSPSAELNTSGIASVMIHRRSKGLEEKFMVFKPPAAILYTHNTI